MALGFPSLIAIMLRSSRRKALSVHRFLAEAAYRAQTAGNTILVGQASQAAEKVGNFVILSEARNLSSI
jgi:hypothetical protein